MTHPKSAHSALRNHVLAALALLALAELLLAGCHHIDPKTYVLGPVTCEREKRESRCSLCFKRSCCAEYQACALDAPCPCYFRGRLTLSASPAAIADTCGPVNAAYTALASCLDEHCADCPVDDAVHRHRLLDKPAPEITAEPLGGEGPKTIHAALGKVVILEFWATWCAPCKKSFAKYQEIADRFPNDVAVLAISVEDPGPVTKEKILATAKEHGARFSILWDSTLRTQAAYDAPPALPSAFVIDRSGTVRSLHVSFDPRIAGEIEALVHAPIAPIPKQQPQGDTPP